MVVSVRSGNCVHCKQYYEYNQNYIYNRNTTEVQNFKIVRDKADKCTNMRQRNIGRNSILNSETIKNSTLRKYFKDFCQTYQRLQKKQTNGI